MMSTIQSWIDLNKLANKSGQPSISQKTIKSLTISVPSLEKQEKIVKELERLRISIKLIKNIQQERDELLEKLPQSILQKAFTGEVT